jgi:hypothetical protein
MSLSKAGGGRGDTRSGSKGDIMSLNWKKMKPVKLPKMRWITKPTTRTNQDPGATIMDRTSIWIKNDTTTMICNLTGRKDLQVKLRYMRNRQHMRREGSELMESRWDEKEVNSWSQDE